MNYQETLEYLFAQLPMFQRDGAAAYKPTLDNTIELCAALGNPHHQFKSIHIAGTNGKGSTSHMLAAIFQSAGYRTGLYTSPHLKDFRERIRVNGEMIGEEKVIAFTETNLQLFETIKPSFFEMTVALAFQHFAEENVDVAIIEVGMGGRLDSTNIIQPELSIITNIGLDHVAFLGNSLPKIAVEKAGIIKNDTPIIIAKTQTEIKSVFEQIAKDKAAPIYFADEYYKLTRLTDSSSQTLKINGAFPNKVEKVLSLDLTGNYQLQNVAGVLLAIQLLGHQFSKISEQSIREGLANVKSTTGLRGRWEVLGTEPLQIADTGHNEDGIKEILKQLTFCDFEQLHWVFGMVNDKDIQSVLTLLPKTASYYFCKPNIVRGLDTGQLKKQAAEYGIEGDCYESVEAALSNAKKAAKITDLVLIAGSTFIVAEIIP